MQSTIRYCRRCRANTDQRREGIGRRVTWSRIFLHLLPSPLRWWLIDPWHCELCAARRERDG